VIYTPRILLRVALLLVAAVVLQLAVLSQLGLFETSPDILPAVVISLGLLGGAMTGAVTGFSTGLLVDSSIYQTMGASSLVLLTVGYLAGRYRESFDVSNSLIPPLLCAALTLFYLVAFAALQLMLGVDAPVSLLVIRDTLVKTIMNFFLGIPIYLGIRRALQPALVEDVPDRGRIVPTLLGGGAR
jgi:rod shape-determining protein MreD